MRLTHRVSPRFRLAGLLILLGGAPLIAQKQYTDDRYGFQMRIPKDFREIPINMDEKWVIAKFLYKRPLEAKREWAERTPELRVIVFPDVDVKHVAAARQKQKKKLAKGQGGKTKVINILEHLQNPFRDYHEYLRENYKKGGWFVKEEKKTRVGGLPALYKFIEVEEKMGSGVKSTLFAWEIDYGDATYVVQLEVLKDHDHKFKGEMRKSLASFEKTPRTEALRPTLTAGTQPSEERKAESAAKKELSPNERRVAREKDLARAISKAKESMTSGWKSFQSGPFTVFYSTSLRFAKRVAKQANLMWDWLNKNFGYVGEDHSVGAIIRVCKNDREANAYMDTSTRSGYGLTSREIVLADDKDWGFNDYGSGRLNQRMLSQFLRDKNPRLWWALPPWLDWGMGLYIDSLKMKGNKMVAKPDEWDMEIIRDSLRDDKFKDAKTLLVTKYGEFQATQQDRVQCFAIVDFLLGKGKKNKTYRTVIDQYIRGLDERLRELYKGKELSKMDKEARAKWATEWKKKREKVYDDCFEKVFGSWSATDWKRFDAAWRKAYKR